VKSIEKVLELNERMLISDIDDAGSTTLVRANIEK
jgi:hypothetical protein